MQIGTSTSDVAWEPTPENGFDQEMLDGYRIYTRLHLRLFPYEWTYAQQIAETGHPIQRPLGLSYPELGVHPSDTYLFGEHLLVAPVLARGVTERQATLPDGQWIEWWTGKVFDGPGEVTLDAPLDRLPLLLRAGALVPMLRPTIDTLSPTTEPTRVDSFVTDAGALWVRVAPGPASSFTVYDGSELSQAIEGSELILISSDGTEFAQGVVFEIMTFAAAPPSVSMDGAPLSAATTLTELDAQSSGYFFDGLLLYVKVPPGAHTLRLPLPG
jgi:alpha-D-xyloside xylohydrolase